MAAHTVVVPSVLTRKLVKCCSYAALTSGTWTGKKRKVHLSCVGKGGAGCAEKQGVLHSHWLNRRTDSIGSEWPLLDCQVQGGSVAMRLSKAAHLPLEDTREQQHASWPAGHDTRYCRWYCGVLPAPCPSDESAQRRVGEKGRRGKPEAALALGHIHSFHCIRTHASV